MPRPTLPASATIGDSGHTTDHNTIRSALAALYEEHTEGAGSPEGAVTATVGRTYADTSGGVLYVKATGSGNTGWVEVGTGAVGGAVAPTNLLTANQAEPTSATGWEAVTNCTVTWVGGTGLVVESLAAGVVEASTLTGASGVAATPGEQWFTGYILVDHDGSSTPDGPIRLELRCWVGAGDATFTVIEDQWSSWPCPMTGSTNFDRQPSDPDLDYLAVQVAWTAAAAGEQLVILKAGLWHGIGGMWVAPSDNVIPGQPAIEGSLGYGAVPSYITAAGVVAWQELKWGPTWTSYSAAMLGFTQGNGTFNRANYLTLGKLMIVDIQFTLGSTSAAASDFIYFTLPTDSIVSAAGQATAYIVDTSSGVTYRAEADLIVISTVAYLRVMRGNAEAVSPFSTSTPFAWASTDVIRACAVVVLS